MGVRRYYLDIATTGLIHIGNGKQYGKRDYFASGNKIAVLDTRKFISRLTAQQVERYCKFLEDGYARLQDFFGKNPDLLRAAEQSVAYKIDSPLATARRGSIQYHDVWEFVKDPYGKPYIPGSSVKGMLRTALLLNMVLDDKELCSLFDIDRVCDVKGKKSAGNHIERRAFWKEQPNPADPGVVNDIMKYVSVSDSAPLSTGDLVFAKKFDKFSKNDPADHKLDMGKCTIKGGNELDVYRECLRPGVHVSVQIAVDDRMDAYVSNPVLDAQG